MRVKDLIRELEKFDQNLRVAAIDGNEELTEVQSLELTTIHDFPHYKGAVVAVFPWRKGE